MNDERAITETNYKVKIHKELSDELRDIFKRKNSDYGDSFSELFEEYGLKSFLIREQDKINRLKELENNERQVDGETIDDTLKDIANYAIMALIERHEKI